MKLVLTIASATALMLGACSEPVATGSTIYVTDSRPTYDRFDIERIDTYMTIITDTETGCKYLHGTRSMTPLLNSEGEPDCG